MGNILTLLNNKSWDIKKRVPKAMVCSISGTENIYVNGLKCSEHKQLRI